VTPPPLARHPYFVSGLALVGLFATFGVMLGFNARTDLGALALAPWVALIGFEDGPAGGAVAAALATGLWVVASLDQDGQLAVLPLAVRIAAFGLLGFGPGLAGRRLRASETSQRSLAALQSALIDSTLDGICLTDAEGHILISNAPLLRLARELGMPPRGTVPERLLAIADRLAEPERYRARMRELATSVQAETSDEFEIAGTGRAFRGYTAPVTDPDGEIAGRVWTLREVTADRELDRMRDAFVATVSHELRTPLTSISGFLEMMEEEEHGVGETGRAYLEVIRRSTDRLHDLVEDLLLVAQIEAHRVELDFEPVDLAALTKRCIEASGPVAAEKRISFELAADGAPLVRGDAHRLSQVIDNIVSNAVKFTGESGSITITIEGDGDVVRLVIADTGIGIPADEQSQVFSRFFRARTATESAIPGTGLGLSISHALVEQHDGTIELESEEGNGTRVTVTLPRSQ
jgi:signal transduction histidine kinase